MELGRLKISPFLVNSNFLFPSSNFHLISSYFPACVMQRTRTMSWEEAIRLAGGNRCQILPLKRFVLCRLQVVDIMLLH